MRAILSMILDYKDKSFRIVLFAMIFAITTYCIYRFVKKEGILKYLIGIALIIVAITSLITGLIGITSDFGLVALEIFFISFTSGIVGIITAKILDLLSGNKSSIFKEAKEGLKAQRFMKRKTFRDMKNK